MKLGICKRVKIRNEFKDPSWAIYLIRFGLSEKKLYEALMSLKEPMLYWRINNEIRKL